MSIAQATHADRLAKLHAPPAATAELDASHHAHECDELERTVVAYLKDQWHIDSTRCFLLQTGANWISMEKFVDSELGPSGKERVNFEWHDPGHDLVAVWRVGSDYIGTAMARQPVDGKPLVVYFSLSRRD